MNSDENVWALLPNADRSRSFPQFLTMASLKTYNRRASAPGRAYRSVDDMLRGHGYRRVAEAVRQLSAKTRVVDQLILARVAAGLTQSQLAAKLRCSQSRISKIEDSQDADLSLGDIHAYARVVGLKLELALR
jgi:ribosome-binding protein aMBF1 (putative translation factor)